MALKNSMSLKKFTCKIYALGTFTCQTGSGHPQTPLVKCDKLNSWAISRMHCIFWM